jgi:hypothetical protein
MLSPLFYQVPKGMDNGMQVMYGCSGHMEELDEENCFHDIVLFISQICPHAQKSVIGFRRTAVNSR